MASLPPPGTGQMPSSFDADRDFANERPLHKVFRKIKEEPLVPLGIGLTVFAFVNAYRALRRGDSKQANKMFRARVAAQGFTVIAMVAGSMYYNQDRQKTKELRKIKEETDAEEKRQRWIRELEARDDEDKAMRAMLEKKARERSSAAAARSDAGQQEGRPGGDAGESAQGGGTGGGILGRMGLWGPAETKAAEEQQAAAAAAAASSKTSAEKKENPRSSLGALGEVYAAKKKEEGESKK